MKRHSSNIEAFLPSPLCVLAQSDRPAGRSGHHERHACESDHFRRPDAAVHGEWQPPHRPPCQPAANTPACAFPTGRRSARDGTSSDNSATGAGRTSRCSSRSAASPPRHVSPPATSSRARCLRTARRGAGDWASPASAATGTSEPSRSTPVAVNDLTGAVGLAAGYGHACALLSNGTMRCWGENREGQLGNGTTANPGTAQPVNVSGITGATAFTTGAYHTCAVLGNGTLRCWGRNGNAQLGNGTFTNSSTPVPVSGITSVRRRQRRGRPHVRGAERRHGAVLGGKRFRATRQRDDHGMRPLRCR